MEHSGRNSHNSLRLLQNRLKGGTAELAAPLLAFAPKYHTVLALRSIPAFVVVIEVVFVDSTR